MARVQRTPIYTLDLLENGLDFVKSGIDLYFGRKATEPRSHKYAILHIFSGVLLLLKERLARIRPSLVFKREAEAGQSGAETTTYHQTLGRLEAQGVRIDPTKRAILDEIRELRNSVEHYRVDISLTRSEEVIGEMVSFVYSFCRDELGVHIDDRLSRRALTRFYGLKEIGDRLYTDAIESANAGAEADERYFQELEQKYAAMSPADVVSHSAARRVDSSEAVGNAECPTCRERTLVLLEVGACTNPQCRATHRLGTCHYCEELAFDGAYWCDSCRYGQV